MPRCYDRRVRLERCRSCSCHIEVGLGCPFCGASASLASSLDARWLGLAVPLLAIVGCAAQEPQGEIYGTPDMIDRRMEKETPPPAVEESGPSKEKDASGESPDTPADGTRDVKPDEEKVEPKPADDVGKPNEPTGAR